MAEPLPLCYLNGAYLPLAEARISPLDRGFLFADGVYEVMPVCGGRPFRFAAHTERLARSLAAINMDDPHVHHDALEFPDGHLVLITRLVPGQRASVLQLPAGISAPTRHADTDSREAVPTPTTKSGNPSPLKSPAVTK